MSPSTQVSRGWSGIALHDVGALIHGLRRPLLVMVAYSSAVVLVHFVFLRPVDNTPARSHGIIGLLLGLLVVFRTNTAYDRWWEARKLWGQLAIECRNLCIKISTLASIGPDEAWQMGEQLARFARTLKDHLQGDAGSVPARVAIVVRELIARWRRGAQIDGFDQLFLDHQANVLMEVAGACDRIRQTPIPRSYLAIVRLSIFLYLATLPWALVNEFDYWTIPASVVLTLFMVGLESIAEHIEDPFGTTMDDLPMAQVCEDLEASLRNIVASAPKHDGPRQTVQVSIDTGRLGKPTDLQP